MPRIILRMKTELEGVEMHPFLAFRIARMLQNHRRPDLVLNPYDTNVFSSMELSEDG